MKNGNVNNNSEYAKSTPMIRAFDKFIPDGVDPSDYRCYSSAPVRIVPANAKLLLVGIFDKSEENMIVKGSGMQTVNPLVYRSIFVPTNATSIDYAPSAEDVGGFKFQTDVRNGGINIELDPVIKVKITDPIKYLYRSNNVMAELKDLVMTVIRGFVAKHTFDELLTTTKYSLSDFDDSNEFEKFRKQYGLKVMDLSFKNAKLPDDITKARQESAVARENINKAKAKREAAKDEALASNEIFRIAVEQARNAGLEGQQLNDFVRMYVDVMIAQNPNAHIFMNSGSGTSFGGAENLIRDMYVRSLEDSGNRDNDRDSRIIDGEYEEADYKEIEDVKTKRRRLK